MDFKQNYRQQFILAKGDLGLSHISQEFKVEYQPLVSVRAKHLVGFEAHLTWQDKRNQLYSSVPMHLIDDTGLSIFVRSWLLRTAIQQLCTWNQEVFIFTPLSLSFTLTEKQWLLPGLPETIKSAAEEMDRSTQGLVIEIAYSTLMNNPQWSADLVKALKNIGVQVRISKFTPCHLSLSTVEKCEISRLKLDATILSNLVQNERLQSLLGNMLQKINDLNIKVTLPPLEISGAIEEIIQKYGKNWHLVSGSPVDSEQAKLLIEDDLKLAQVNVSLCLNEMNRLSQFAKTLLGESLVHRYWHQACPNNDWLKADIVSGLEAGHFEVSDDFRLSTNQIHDIEQWVYRFIDRCSRVILNLRSLIETSDLMLADVQLFQLQGDQQTAAIELD